MSLKILTPGNILDIILLLWLTYFIIHGLKTGVFRSLFAFGRLVLSIIFSRLFASNLAVFLSKNTSIKDFIINKMPKASNIIYDTKDGTINSEGKKIILEMYNSNNNPIHKSITSFYDSIANIMINSLSFILIFLISMILLKILANAFTNTKNKQGKIGCINGLLGASVGFIKGSLVIYICILIFNPIITYSNVTQTKNMSKITEAFKTSKIVNYVVTPKYDLTNKNTTR